MLVYVLHPTTFERVSVIEEYISCIWTERFIDPGEAKLVVPGTHAFAKLLVPGTLLEHEDSDVPMLIETRETKGGNITANGTSLETFFNQRSLDRRTKTDSPGRIMGALVEDMQTQFGGEYAIPGLRVSDTALADGDDVTEKLTELSKVHETLLGIAKKYIVGMDVRRLEKSVGVGYELVFTTRKGVDRTNGNPDGIGTVRFSPRDDNFANTNEVYSVVDDVYAVTVRVPRRFRGGRGLDQIGVDLLPATYPDELSELDLPPFGARIRELDGEIIDVAYLRKRGGYTAEEWDDTSDASKKALLYSEMQRLAEAEYKKLQQNSKRAVDGEVTSTNLRYRRDYHLGDLVEVEGTFADGVPYGQRTAMVSEYILTSDETGARAYPTLSAPVEEAPYESPPPSSPAEKETVSEFKLEPYNDAGWYHGSDNLGGYGMFRACIHETANNRRRVELSGSVRVRNPDDLPDIPDISIARLPPECHPAHLVHLFLPLASSGDDSDSSYYQRGWVVRIYPRGFTQISADPGFFDGRIVLLGNHMFGRIGPDALPKLGDVLSFDGMGWDLDSKYTTSGNEKPAT